MIKLQDALEKSLEQIAAGEATADDCAARYPQYASELRSLLKTAERLQASGKAISPPPAFKDRGRARLLAHMRAHPHTTASARAAQSPQTTVRRPLLPGLMHGMRRRPFAALLVAACVLLIFVTSAAQAALPGDPLYGWKRAGERVWRAAHPHPLAADLALSNRRAGELIRVAGEEEAAPLARESYREALEQLATYDQPQERARIAATVAGQRAQLDAAGVQMPEVEELLPSALPPPQSTPAPAEEGPGTQPATATPTPLPDPTTTESDPAPLPTVDPPGALQETPLPPVLETVSPDLDAPEAEATPTLPQILPTVDTNLP